jgi:hypothetical protein
MKSLLSSSLLFSAAATGLAATTIYSDDFSGVAGADLTGSAPDIRPGSQTWTANLGFDFTGSNGTNTVAGSVSRAAYLPFVPQSGFVYELSVTMAFATTGSQSRSLQMGFFSSGTPGLTTAITSGANGPAIFLRQVGTYEARAVSNTSLPGFTGTVGGANVTTPQTFRITLDTSGSDWVMRTYLGATEIGTGHTYTGGNPSIASVGLSVNTSGDPGASAEGTFSNFSLTSTPIPEPSSALLFSAALLPAAWLRRRGK